MRPPQHRAPGRLSPQTVMEREATSLPELLAPGATRSNRSTVHSQQTFPDAIRASARKQESEACWAQASLHVREDQPDPDRRQHFIRWAQALFVHACVCVSVCMCVTGGWWGAVSEVQLQRSQGILRSRAQEWSEKAASGPGDFTSSLHRLSSLGSLS